MSDTRYLDAGGQQNAYMSQVVTAGLKGAVLGLAGFIPASYYASRRYPAFRSLPLPGKAFLGLMTIVPIGTVFAEKAGEKFIAANQWTGVGRSELEHQAYLAQQRWQQLSTSQKIKDWSARHQYAIIGGSWVASLGIAFGIVARNKYQTFPQKLVQARMWAQGLTVGVLIASAVLAGVNSKGKKPELPPDHSWQDILEQGGNLTKADRIILHHAKKSIPQVTV